VFSVELLVFPVIRSILPLSWSNTLTYSTSVMGPVLLAMLLFPVSSWNCSVSLVTVKLEFTSAYIWWLCLLVLCLFLRRLFLLLGLLVFLICIAQLPVSFVFRFVCSVVFVLPTVLVALNLYTHVASMAWSFVRFMLKFRFLCTFVRK